MVSRISLHRQRLKLKKRILISLQTTNSIEIFTMLWSKLVSSNIVQLRISNLKMLHFKNLGGVADT